MEKLSVQERLSLAAKGKSKAKRKAKRAVTPSLASDTNSESQETEGTQLAALKSNESNTCLTESSLPPQDSIPEKADNSMISRYFSNLLEINEEDISSITTEELLTKTYPLILRLEKSVGSLTEALNESKSASNSDSSLIKLIKEKDAQIEELMKEGEALSKRELQLSDTIKKLNKTVSRLTSDINIKSDDIKEFKEQLDVLKSTNKSLQVLLKDNEKRIESLEKENGSLKSAYEQLVTNEYEKVKHKSKELLEENEKLLEKIEALKHEEGLKQKNFDVKYKALQDTSKEEVNRLEIRLEQLRIDLENTGDRFDQKAISSDDQNDAYDKLMAQYRSTQHELSQTNENWASIEYALNEQCSSLKTSIDEVQTENDKLISKLKELEKSYKDLTERFNCIQENNSKLETELAETTILLTQSNEKLSNLTEDYDLLQKLHEIQKRQLEKAVSTQHVNSESSRESEKKFPIVDDYVDPLTISKEDQINKWNIGSNKLGDLMETNSGDENIEDFSFDRDEEIPEDAADLERLNRRSSGISMTLSASNTKPTTTRGSQSNNTNVQIVNRLGAEVRRLETELSSLRDACKKLSEDKEAANAEISRLLETVDQLEEVRSQSEILQKESEDLHKKQSTILQLLGEKTERVEELENDVQDLKDLMHTQVQQIVQLQDQIR